MSGPEAATTPAAAPAVPEEFVCLITHRLMRDAVVDHEGNSYDKQAIEEWLEKNQTSPHTRTPLRKTQLAPNRVLRGMIDKWKAANGFTDPEAATTASGAPLPAAGASPAPSVPAKVSKACLRVKPGADNTVFVSLVTPPGPSKPLATTADVPKARLPAAVMCCVDVSGSMRALATVKNDQGHAESNGLTQLDLVKHATRTVMQSLTERDAMGLVTFSTTAKMQVPLVPMTPENKKRISKVLDGLQPTGMTNLWDGLYKGMEELRNADCPGNTNLMLFTDGRPTVVPPRGHLGMLLRYRDDHQVLPGAINTYGFGYELDSELLSDLAKEGGGSYAFIPDSSLLGSVFVNSVSNQLAKCGRDLVVNLEEGAPVTLAAENYVAGGYPNTRASWGVSANLGPALFGQTRDAVFRLGGPVSEVALLGSVTGSWFNLETRERETLEVVLLEEELSMHSGMPEKRDSAELHLMRLRTVEAVQAVNKMCKAKKYDEAAAAVRTHVTEMKLCSVRAYPELQALQKDVEGQVLEAVAAAAHQKWGAHYLPSLSGAHLLQQCNNFKDPGVQQYGGPLFTAISDVLVKAFLSLPPPMPQTPVHVRQPGGYGGAQPCRERRQSKAAPVKMDNYYNRGGGCFAGACVVDVVVGEEAVPTRVDSVRQGDLLVAADGTAQPVVCVVRTEVPSGAIEMRRFEGGLTLTPYHPMRVGGEWVFPAEARGAAVCTVEAGHVYDFVLGAVGAVAVNGVPCVTLGHGITEGAAAHQYFGSSRVLEDLAALPGFASGKVTLHPDSLQRSSETNLVTGIGAALP